MATEESNQHTTAGSRQTPIVVRRWTWLVVLNLLAMTALAIWFRCRDLGCIPGLNGDEAWYGVQVESWLAGGDVQFRTPTGNFLNPFFVGPLLALHALFSPSVALLRSVAVVSGLLAIPLAWWGLRKPFGPATAIATALLLAILPVNIAYSRFAWDAAQILPATLLVMFCALATLRAGAWWPVWLAVGAAAQFLALCIHPASIFAAAALGVAFFQRFRRDEAAKWFAWLRQRPVWLALSVLLVAAALAIGALGVAAWWRATGPEMLASRLQGIHAIVYERGVGQFLQLFPRLITGDSVYRFLAGSRSWSSFPRLESAGNFGLDIPLFWAAVVASLLQLGKSWRQGNRLDGWLLGTWILSVAGCLVVSGPVVVLPDYSRYALVLIAPTAMLFARAGVLAWQASSAGKPWILAAGIVLGWAVLGDFDAHYFRYVYATGGSGHRTFRTADIDPKQALLEQILREETARPACIVADDYWSYWTLRYFAARSPGQAIILAPEEQATSPEWSRALSQGQAWQMAFSVLGDPEIPPQPPRENAIYGYDFAGNRVLVAWRPRH